MVFPFSGGQTNNGGIEHASIVVNKDIHGFSVSHGVFNSFYLRRRLDRRQEWPRQDRQYRSGRGLQRRSSIPISEPA